MEIKKKTLSREEWYTDEQRAFQYAYHKDEYFEGAVGLITFIGLTEPDTVPAPNGELCIADNGYKWLELVPKNKNWVLTSMFDKNSQLFQCYFDITAQNEISEDGNACFFDAFLDVVISETGEPMILDQDELDMALQEHVIDEQAYKLYSEVADELVEWIKKDKDRIYTYLKKILAEMC